MTFVQIQTPLPHSGESLRAGCATPQPAPIPTRGRIRGSWPP